MEEEIMKMLLFEKSGKQKTEDYVNLVYELWRTRKRLIEESRME